MIKKNIDALNFDQIYSSLLDMSKSNQLMNFDEKWNTNLKFSLTNEEVLSALSEEMTLLPQDTKLKRKSFLMLEANEEEYESKLASISYTSSVALSEQSVHTMYIAFGTLVWKDDEGEKYKSPLLLLPVKFCPKSAKDPYQIKADNLELLFNITLEYRMRQQDLQLTLPPYEAGMALTEYFKTVRKRVSEYGWKVTENTYLGVFSFPKINIYYDIRNNENIIKAHPFMRALSGDPSQISPLNLKYDNGRVDDNIPAKEDYHVLDCDATQRAALLAAARGKSFVLEGPPGTGKSQTIINMIAQALSMGKRILFVAQKKAALDVIYNGLKRTGLSDFCLPLYTNDESSRAILTSLFNSLNMERTCVRDEEKEKFVEYDEVKHSLNEYVDRLHHQIPGINMSLYEIIDSYIRYYDAKKLKYEIKDLQKITPKVLEKHKELLKQYHRYTQSLMVNNYKDCLFYGFKPEISINIKNSEMIKEVYYHAGNVCTEFFKVVDTIKDIINVISFDKIEDLINYSSTYLQLAKISPLNPNWFTDSNAKIRKEVFKEFNTIFSQYQDLTKKLDGLFSEKILVDLPKLEVCFSKNGEGDAKFYKKEISANKKIFKQYRIRAGLSPEEIIEYTKTMIKIGELKNLLKEGEQTYTSILGSDYKGLDTNISSLSDKINISYEFSTRYSKFVNEDFISKIQTKIILSDSQVTSLNSSALIAKNLFDSINKLQEFFTENTANFFNLKPTDFAKKLSASVENMEVLTDYMSFIRYLAELEEEGLKEYLDFALDNNLDSKELENAYLRVFFAQLLDAIGETDYWLDIFNGEKHYDGIEKFKDLDQYKKALNVARIMEELSRKRPLVENAAKISEIGILNLQKANKKMPVKKLISSIPNLLPRIKPCLLMSPSTVSTFLRSDDKFDICIFDEASQITPGDAVGSIYRSKQVIVVGDREQLSPTNFFKKLDEEYILSEEDEMFQLGQSILEAADSVLESIALKWHYRSLNEELIAVSNRLVYNDSLFTFLGARTALKDEGVERYFLEDSRYTSIAGKRCNPDEASKVIELIDEHIKYYPNRSLGIVTLNIGQRDTILDALRHYQKKNRGSKVHDEFFSNLRKEPFFVKNLENVQGDERDTIIFSISYGKDETGNISQNFGPITQETGYRRLNVAISRAKINMKIVCSIRSDDILVLEEKSRGVMMFKEFLYFAETKSFYNEIPQEKRMRADRISYIQEKIYSELAKKGFVIDKQIGQSDFKIDLAIRDTKDTTNKSYALGIFFDGYNYTQCQSCSDRERLRDQVLINRNWVIYHVWSTVFYMNPESEIKKIITLAEKSLNSEYEYLGENSYNYTLMERIVYDKKVAFDNYQKLSFLDVNERLKYSNVIKGGSKLENRNDAKSKQREILDFYGQKSSNTVFEKRITVEEGDERFESTYWTDFAEHVMAYIDLEGPMKPDVLGGRVCEYFVANSSPSQSDSLILMEKYQNGLFPSYIEIDDEGYFINKNDIIDGKYIKFKQVSTQGLIRAIDSIHYKEIAYALDKIIFQFVGITKESLYKEFSRYCGYADTDDLTENETNSIDRALEHLLNNDKIKIVEEFIYSKSF